MPSESPLSTRCRGMRDLLPNQMARFRRIEDAFRAVASGWGYQEVRTPTIEYLHLFTGAGTLSPDMLQRIYSFLDWDGWSGERVVLRPDATIPAARLYTDTMPPGKDARLFYVQNVFRFAEGDDHREGWQCGVERLGAPPPQADLELILLGLATLRSLGLPSPTLSLSHTGVVRAALAHAGLSPDEQLAEYDRILRGDLSGLADIEARLPSLGAPLRLLFETEGDRAYVANIRAAFATAIPDMNAPLDELGAIAETLTTLGEPYTISTALARNFEYYTGAVFRFESAGKRVGGGGRYDGLLRLVGGHDIPASGFALEVEAIAPLLPETRAGRGVTYTVRAARPEPELLARAHETAAALRERGLTALLNGGGAEEEAAHAEVIVEAKDRLRLRGSVGEGVYSAPEQLALVASGNDDAS